MAAIAVLLGALLGWWVAPALVDRGEVLAAAVGAMCGALLCGGWCTSLVGPLLVRHVTLC